MAARRRVPDPPPHSADAKEVLVNVLSARIDQTYMTAGSVGGRRLVRDVLERINAGALTAVVSELGLEKEFTREVARLGGD